MPGKNDRIVMLPHVKKGLEEQALGFIEDKKFDQALKVIDQLIFHEINQANLNLGKIVCLVELNRLEDAVIFVEGLLREETKDYYLYLEYYLTLLFQNNEYDEILRVLREETPDLPEELAPLFSEYQKMAFQMSEKMKLVQAKELLTALEVAINDADDTKQWLLINQLRKLHIQPPNEIKKLLINEEVHPVVKTSIFNWFRTVELEEALEISKYGKIVKADPKAFPSMVKHPVVERTLLYLLPIEQENPTLYKMIEDLFIKYIYVHYPILYKESDARPLAQALKTLAETSLYGEEVRSEKADVQSYIDEITRANKAYYEVIHE